jgi:hypothetical protein
LEAHACVQSSGSRILYTDANTLGIYVVIESCANRK